MPPSTFKAFEIHFIPQILENRLCNIFGLIGGGLHDRPGDVAPVGKLGESGDDSSGIGTPVRGKKTRKGGDAIDIPVVFNGFGQGFNLRCRVDQPQVVPDPLDQGPGIGNGAFKGVNRGRFPNLIHHRGEQAMVGKPDITACVEQEKTAGTIGVFRLPGGKAGLAEQGGLLVS